jgi:hypothetical protein
MSQEYTVVYAENIDHFMDQVIELAVEGWVRVPTNELAFAVETNFWKMTMVKGEAVIDVEPEEPAVLFVDKVLDKSVDKAKKAGKAA